MSSRRLVCSGLLTALVTVASSLSYASTAAASPGWTITSIATPAHFAPGSTDGAYQVFARNSGSSPAVGPVTMVDKLPPGVKVYKATPTAAAITSRYAEYYSENYAPYAYPLDELGNPLQVQAARGPEMLGRIDTLEGHSWWFPCTVADEATVVSCTYEHGPVNPSVSVTLTIRVEVSSSLEEGEEVTNTATVAGGGAPSASTSETTPISSTTASYGIKSFTFNVAEGNGLTDTQAGDHPYETTVSYVLNTVSSAQEGVQSQGLGPVRYETPRVAGQSQTTKDLIFDVPPGLVGDPQAIPKCSAVDVEHGDNCPADTQIGVVSDFILNSLTARRPPEVDENRLYNISPEPGQPADFRFFETLLPINLAVNVNQETNYAVRVSVLGIPQIANVIGTTTTFFGTPSSDSSAFDNNHSEGQGALLANPVNCSAGPLTARLSTDSWQHPGAWLANGSPDLSDPNWKTKTATVYPSMTGCDLLQFQPSVTVTPDSSQADEPTGVTVDVHVPQSPNAFPHVATPELKNVTVTLPAGMSVSPSAADGLQACGDAQVDVSSTEPSACPNGSVLGTVRIKTPLLPAPLEGHVFLGAPECDPCSSVDAADGKELRIYIEAYGAGVRLKKEGRIRLNPSTGQLTTTFTENPQDPVEDVELHFKGGLRAGLATPQTCGTFTTTGDISAWSSPVTPDATPVSSFNVDSNGSGGACPGVWPLSPSFSSGTSNPNAGQFTPLTLSFGREDREQDLSGIQVHMPAGLLGVLSGVSLCGEPQASLGTCGEGSRIGSMTVAAGPGSHPFYTKGSIYITGPYKGAPFGLSIVVPTVAGPFNLGNVVVRAKINVDPLSTALTVTSDAFPQIIDGIPLRLRSANVTIDRPGFIFNPTNCEQLKVSATITGAQGTRADVSVPFAVSGCAGLPFGPKFVVSTSAHTSRVNGASLDAKVLYPAGAQSNISKVKVELPKQLPARLTTLQKACVAATFEANPALCPAASVVGIARASTPVLPVPLTGPAYFVSHGGEAFPNLIVVLQGYGVRVDLVGDTFISKAGITSSTFENIPDVQVNSFELYFPEGPGSALAANGNLCKGTLLMPTSFVAQDGAQLKQKTKIQVTGCPKGVAKKKRGAKASRAKKASHRHTGHRGGKR